MPVKFSDDPMELLPELLRKEELLEDKLRLVRLDIDTCRFKLEMSGRIKRFGGLTVLLATPEEIEKNKLVELKKFGI